MSRKNRTPKRTSNKQKNSLDKVNFNFLELLLMFCTLTERSVPKESGVHFRINSKAEDKSLCLLFEIDRKEDPLIDEGARPDYMVLYVKNNICICTIIELKGKSEKKSGARDRTNQGTER